VSRAVTVLEDAINAIESAISGVNERNMDKVTRDLASAETRIQKARSILNSTHKEA
jgi:hypothetical protein